MKLQLNYFVHGQVYKGMSNPDANWLEQMVKANPDVIFFYTTETTDIWGMRSP